ncbi:hypothetical protein J6590_082750 [Homalodisca vitripennis]|nr:hypothetical protein J6590_082750 [Homalodisca vitripennis]
MDRTSVKMCQAHFLSCLKLQESCGIRGLPHRCLLSYLKDINKSVQIAHVMKNKVNMPYGIRRNLSSGDRLSTQPSSHSSVQAIGCPLSLPRIVVCCGSSPLGFSTIVVWGDRPRTVLCGW